jgi:hypothetical protein
MTKLIGTGPNQVPSNADLGTLAYQNDDNVTLGLTTIATEGDEPRQGGGTLLRVKRTGNGTWATLAIEAQSYRGNSRIAFVDSDYPNDVLTTGTANGGGAAPFIFDYEHETEKFQMISNAASRITVDSTGKVGIGTDVPTRNLTVKAGSGQEGIELIDADESLFLIQKSGTSTNTSYVSMLSEGDTTVRLHADNVSYFNGGNVGIGTTAPDGKFTVSNSGAEGIEFFPAAASAVNTTQHYNRSGSAYVKNRTIALNHEWVNGATDPAMNLIPDGDSTFLVLKAKASTYSSTANLSLYGTNPNINGGSLVSRATVQAQTDGTAFGTKLRLLTNNASNVETRALTVDASQNVGIGTDSPDLKLDVSHGTTAEYVATFQNTADNLELKIGTTTGALLNIQGQVINSGAAYNIGLQTDGGNVGIGTSNPGYKLTVNGDFQSLGMYSYGGTNLGGNSDGRTDQTILGGFGILASDGNRYGNYGNLAFRSSANYTGSSRPYLITNGYKANCFAIIQGTTASTIPDISGTAGGANNGTPKFVIDSGGKTCIGLDDASSYGAQLNVQMAGGSGNAMLASINSSVSGTRRHIDFFDGSSTSRKGAIETNGTSTTYSTTSDRRLKDNIQPITDATKKLMTMNPVTHTWISNPDEPKVHGFIAQEMQEVVPEAVSGDAESDEMMSMDYGRITPVLVAALQEANKKISELEARLNDAGL